jgi:CBS domain-containing protein
MAMLTMSKPLREMTAADLMSRDVFVLLESTSLRDAARSLLDHRVSGAPVVDQAGRLLGVLSAGDYLRRAAGRDDASPHARRPLTCSFQARHRLEDGREETLCQLSPGVCPIQVRQQGPTGEDLLVCREPHSVPVDWQIVELEKLPTDDVGRYMTPCPVTAEPEMRIGALARKMLEAHIHRLIVVDEAHRPVGIVSGTDLLAALADSEGEAPAS